MIADAVHSLSDFFTDIVLVFSFRVVKQPADDKHGYGHGKFETLASTVVGASLLIVGGGLLYYGGRNIYLSVTGKMIISAPSFIVLIVAVISIVIKEYLYLYTVKIGKKINSQAIIANAWHHRSDAFSSIGTSIGISGAYFLGEKWRILDPIAAVIVSIFIFKVAFKIIIDNIKELVETSLDEETEKEILQIVKDVPGAMDPHNMKTRRIGSNIAIDMHIRVDKKLTIVKAHDIATNIEETLKEKFGNMTFVNIHTEPKYY